VSVLRGCLVLLGVVAAFAVGALLLVVSLALIF
jgi:hypothetical protein